MVGLNGVEGGRFKVQKHRARGVSLPATVDSVVIMDVNALELLVHRASVGSCRINAVLFRDCCPEFATQYITTLACLYVHNSSPFRPESGGQGGGGVCTDVNSFDASFLGLSINPASEGTISHVVEIKD